MDRRQFIQVAGAMGATRTASAHVEPRFAVIAVGGIGRAVLSDPSPRLPYRPRTIAINTDAAGLGATCADRKILVGDGTDQHRPVCPAAAARLVHAVIDEILTGIRDVDVAFLVVGMGGIAGTGISPVVAQSLRDKSILTLACAIMPFDWEGESRRQVAEGGIQALWPGVDALIQLSNVHYADAAADDTLLSAVLAQAPAAFWQRYREAAGLAMARVTGQRWKETLREVKAVWV